MKADTYLKNHAGLISRGDGEARQQVLAVLESSLNSLDSYRIISSNLTLTGDILTFGSNRWYLSQKAPHLCRRRW